MHKNNRKARINRKTAWYARSGSALADPDRGTRCFIITRRSGTTGSFRGLASAPQANLSGGLDGGTGRD